MKRVFRVNRPTVAGHRPLDAAIDALRTPAARAVLEPTSLSERAARCLELGPCDALRLMRDVCRVDRLKAEAAERMADVLLGARADFVQLDDDRWALLRDGQVVRGTTRASETLAPSSYDAAHVSLSDDGVAAGGAKPQELRAPGSLRPPVVEPLSLDTLRFAVVDVETTGSHAGTLDRITEIAIVPVSGGLVEEPWQQLVQPGRSIPPFISVLTGITNAMVADAPRFHAIADDVCARLDGLVFTAHNAAFDWRFVDAELSRTCRTRLQGQSLCTVRLSRKFLPSLSKRSLDRVCAYFGIRIDGRHRAGGDALATAHALVRLLDVVRDAGIDTWPQLQQHLNGTVRRSTRRSALPTPVQEDHSA